MQINDQGRQLGDLCSALVRRLRLLERSEMSCCGIPMSQAVVLQTLEANEDGQRMSAVADALGVAQSTATRLVEPLVRDGQVCRKPASDDGRAVVIALTGKGRQTATELSRLSRRWSEGILQRIPSEQHQGVITALETVIEAVNDCCATGCEPELVQLQRRSGQ